MTDSNYRSEASNKSKIMKRKINGFLFGNYTRGEGIKGLWILGITGLTLLLLMFRSLML